MGSNDDLLVQARSAALDRLLSSTSRHRLIVAGPGTGKTFAFKRVLETVDGPVLVLTFLNNLVTDLTAGLGVRADVYSFHGFSRRLLHQIDGTGVSRSARYYPQLVDLLIEDIRILLGQSVARSTIGGLFRNLADTDELLQVALRSGEYYDSVAHDDAVYRVLQGIEADDSRIPAFSLLLVDEFQDFSPLEVAFIDALHQRMPTLIVGDDDQALYAFRNATPQAIRALAADGSYERFDLPFCTRCTEVVIAATHRVVEQATALGLLRGRIDKPYECFLPDKQADSERYPRIIYAHCSVQMKSAPYIARYIDHMIGEIPNEDIESSQKLGHPTVLIVGPNPFLGQVEAYLRDRRPNVVHISRADLEIEPLAAYRILRSHPDSNLAWRILLQVYMPPGWSDAVKDGLTSRLQLVELIDESFVDEQRQLAALVGRADEGSELSSEERRLLAGILGCSLEVVDERLHPTDPQPEEPDRAAPTIMLTSLLGSKGLQADHVVIMGLNEGHFPHRNDQITDEEVCQLLVALTRTRKSCTIVSTGRLGGQRLGRSRFIDWLRPLLDEVSVDKTYFER